MLRRRTAFASCAALVVACVPLGAQDARPPYHSEYRVINVHRHFDAADPRAVAAELAVLDRVGGDVVVVLDGRWPGGGFEQWAELKKKHPDRLVLFGNVDFGRRKQQTFFEDIVRDLEVQHKLGCQGIKFFKQYGMEHRDAEDRLIAVDDPRMDPFFAKCGELGLPVLIHSADPKEYWYPRTYNSDHYGIEDRPRHWENPRMPSWETLIAQRNRLLAKHPRTTFVGAHMGSLTYDLQQLAETLDKFPNFHVECSARLRILGRLNPQAVRDFFTKYQDRVLFGTDSTALNGADAGDAQEVGAWLERGTRFYARHLEYFETDRFDLVEPYGFQSAWLRLAGAKLPPAVLEKFYHANAERLIPGCPTAAQPR